MFKVRLVVWFDPRTDDHQAALDATRALMLQIQDSHPGAITFGPEVRVVDLGDDESRC